MRVRGLSVSYRGRDGRAIRALDHVNLEISAWEIVGLLGESGCGKSTLGAAMLRLLPPYADCRGQMFFEGRDLLRLSESELCRVRVVNAFR